MLKWIVKNVMPQDNYILELWFNDGSHKLYDMKPLLNGRIFSRLKSDKLFNKVFVNGTTVEWPGEIDVAPEELYENSVEI